TPWVAVSVVFSAVVMVLPRPSTATTLDFPPSNRDRPRSVPMVAHVSRTGVVTGATAYLLHCVETCLARSVRVAAGSAMDASGDPTCSATEYAWSTPTAAPRRPPT